MAESKRFFQVFPELKLENNLTELLSLVQIDRIAANHKKDAIRVYMTGTRIIPKKSIYMVQDEIEKQMFGTGNIRVQTVYSTDTLGRVSGKYYGRIAGEECGYV